MTPKKDKKVKETSVNFSINLEPKLSFASWLPFADLTLGKVSFSLAHRSSNETPDAKSQNRGQLKAKPIKKQATKRINIMKDSPQTFLQSSDSVISLLEEYEKQTFNWLSEEAKKGVARAQTHLGALHYRGEGVNQNDEKAFLWFSRAAKQGDAVAQFALGGLYYLGEGVAINCNKAFLWLNKAAEQNHTDAQDTLGILYYMGEGVTQNYDKAFLWLNKAAEQGHADAQNNLGVLYYRGKSVAKNYKQAFFWWREATDQWHALAQNNLGGLYYMGKSVVKNYKQAFFWWREATEQGLADAQYNLGMLYAKGEGVKKDLSFTYSLFLLAARGGNENAKNFIASLKQHLTPQQIVEGKKIAQEWQKKIEEGMIFDYTARP